MSSNKETTTKVFSDKGTWAAKLAAEAWCEGNGISVGTMCGTSPRGLKRGAYAIAKWHNISPQARTLLDGEMTGDMREGPVTVQISNAGTAK